MISIFVGNDLDFAQVEAERPDARLRGLLERERVLLWVLPRRLARVSAERARRDGAVGLVQGEREYGRALDRAQLAEAFPWIEDPLLEQETLSADAFLRLETERALAICAADPISFDGCVQALLAMRAAAGDTQLCVVIVPDEFQVEDELWASVRERAGVALDRDRAQRLLKGWLTAQGIPHLDLLPVLRAVPPLADGQRHLFHLRDTHFNTRGNRAAGEALSDFLRPLLR